MRILSKNLWLIYPILLALYPPIALFGANLGQVGFEKIVLPLVFSIVFSLLAWLVIFLITRNLNKSSLLTAIIQAGFFAYGHVYNILEGTTLGGLVIGRHRFLLVIWLLLMAAIFIWFLRLKTISPNVNQALVMVALFMVLLPTAQIVVSLINSREAEAANLEGLNETNGSNLVLDYKPDIYYIILDTYTRTDVLRDEYGYDNSEFIDFLRNTGFYIADCAKSNFNQTNLSLYLSLNMDYLADATNFEDVSFGRGIRSNAARKELEKLGYQTVAFETGYNFTEWFNADYYFLPTSTALGTNSILSKLGSFDILFLRSTLLSPIIDENIQQANYAEASYRRYVTLFTIEKLKEIPQISGPKLVFVHLSINHPPFVFGPDGDSNPDLAKIRKPKAENDAYYKGYKGTFPFADEQIQDVVEVLLKNSEQPPVIILQGDHGPETVDSSKHYEILNALYLPGVDTTDLYPTISPINTFRVIFNKYFGMDLELLPDQSYSSRPGKAEYMLPITCPVE